MTLNQDAIELAQSTVLTYKQARTLLEYFNKLQILFFCKVAAATGTDAFDLVCTLREIQRRSQ
jgi:hypothetical protein